VRPCPSPRRPILCGTLRFAGPPCCAAAARLAAGGLDAAAAAGAGAGAAAGTGGALTTDEMSLVRRLRGGSVVAFGELGIFRGTFSPEDVSTARDISDGGGGMVSIRITLEDM